MVVEIVLTINFNLVLVDQFGQPRIDISAGYRGAVYYRWRTSSGARSADFPIDFSAGRAVFPFRLGDGQSIEWLYFVVSTTQGQVRSEEVGVIYGTDASQTRNIEVKAVVPKSVQVGDTQPALTPGAYDVVQIDTQGNVIEDLSTPPPSTMTGELVSYVPQAAFDVAVGQIWDTINPMKTQVNKIDQIIMPQILAQQKSIDVFNNELGILRTRSEVDRVSISDINKRLNDPVFGINAINAGLKQASIDMQTVNARTEANAANIADLAEALNTDLENRPPPSSGGNWWDGILAGFGGAGVGAIVALIVIALVVMRK